MEEQLSLLEGLGYSQHCMNPPCRCGLQELAIASVYGFQSEGEDAGSNEELLQCLLAWKATLKVPCILAGDFQIAVWSLLQALP